MTNQPESQAPQSAQEKMNKIYELTGIEPRWYTHAGVQLTINNGSFDPVHDLPHYPAEQLWELSSIPGYKLDEPHEEMSIEYWFDHKGCADLLTALLDMVLWCIEENYIKRGEG